MPESVRSSARRSSKSTSSHSEEVNYSHSKKLSIPKETSSITSWTRTAYETCLLLSGGYSLAVALGEDVDASISSPVELAESLLTPREAEMLYQWRKGRSPPKVDWRRLSTSLHASTSIQRARWAELTDALRILYGGDSSISKENCKAWVEKYQDQMSLLIACKKVETARRDAKGAKAGSRAKRDVREIVACRTIISHFGKQRVRSNTELKKLQKDSTDKEAELSKKLARLDGDNPRDKESTMSRYSAREAYWSKLTKVRMQRIEASGVVGRQNTEINIMEKALKARIAGLEDRLKRMR